MPPPFTPTHRWICPYWRWSHGTITSPAVFPSIPTTFWFSSYEHLFVANWTPVSIRVHVDCYSADGALVADGHVAGVVGPRMREQASLSIERDVVYDDRGNYSDGDEGWFALYATGPVVPAVRYTSTTTVETFDQWVPIDAVPEFTVDVAPPPPYVPGAAAAEAAAGTEFVATLSIERTQEWFTLARMRGLRPRDDSP